MKVVRLLAENIKRIKVVNIEPGDASLVTIGGKNSAGKSSVLDAVAYALGGEKLVPSEPIRSGESEAKIVVDLGDLVVTRRFYRDITVEAPSEDQVKAAPDAFHQGKKTFGETKSSLTVTNRDGARYPSPQAVLDRLLGKLTFDPLAFARMDPKPQDETLRKLVGLDVAPIEARKKQAFDQRAMLKKTHQIKEAQLAALPRYESAPSVEVPMEEIAQQMLKAEEYRKLAEDAERGVAKVRTIIDGLANHKSALLHRQKFLQKEIDELQTEINNANVKLEDEHKALDAASITAKSALSVVPDVAVIRQRLTDAEAANAKVRANQKHMEAAEEVKKLEFQWIEQQSLVDKAEQEKRDALASAKFPVPGLGLSDDSVTFNGLPLSQAGSAEQLRVSVSIGAALNPQLRVLLIRNGNLLDADSLKAVAEQAEQANLQLWMEYVSESKDGVAVMLVDGEVV